jgi:hypothetical protein
MITKCSQSHSATINHSTNNTRVVCIVNNVFVLWHLAAHVTRYVPSTYPTELLHPVCHARRRTLTHCNPTAVGGQPTVRCGCADHSRNVQDSIRGQMSREALHCHALQGQTCGTLDRKTITTTCSFLDLSHHVVLDIFAGSRRTVREHDHSASLQATLAVRHESLVRQAVQAVSGERLAFGPL